MTISSSEQATATRQKSKTKTPAIARAAAILRLLGKQSVALPLQTIARQTALVPSTCLYVLRALVDEELVAFDADTKRYSLAAGVLTLARQWLSTDGFASAVQTQLDQISDTFGVTSLGVQVFGLDHIVVIATSSASHNFQISAQVGTRFPALISATGRCIAAWSDCPQTELHNRFERLRWDKAPDFDDWLAQVRRARALGYAVDDGNYIAGIKVLAAPVWTAGEQPSHALVALGIGSALKGPDVKRLGNALDSAARALTLQFCGSLRRGR